MGAKEGDDAPRLSYCTAYRDEQSGSRGLAGDGRAEADQVRKKLQMGRLSLSKRHQSDVCFKIRSTCQTLQVPLALRQELRAVPRPVTGLQRTAATG